MSYWSVELCGRVAMMTFARPPRNFLDFTTMADLGDLLADLASKSDEVKVVMLTGGVDDHFVADGDLADRRRAVQDGVPEGILSWLRLTCLLRDMPQPAVAAIDGRAFGGGGELALACQLRIGSERARLGRLPPLNDMGLDAAAAPRGRIFTAQEALGLGWLNAVLPMEGFVDAALAWCQELADLVSTALMAAKKVLVRGVEWPLQQRVELEIAEFLGLVGTGLVRRNEPPTGGLIGHRLPAPHSGERARSAGTHGGFQPQ
ncbi:enoyl-CoA hydratase/isomerase family protein [Streptomyces sp. NPDC003038]|uniref:enoyl-CoA hydratase/isomerase family protein n=1 Tax=unclassified Streptomyces TaxID=2593676 RepID=UPI0033B1D18A